MGADSDDERICRFCFEGEDDGTLISPCSCAGGQKYVHLKCLRQWQRMSLASQPTHPAFWNRDSRHHTCNVCKTEFTCAPPTRHELMASFTGPEIAALIDKNCIIVATQGFSDELERQVIAMPMLERIGGGRHWFKSVLLITSVQESTRLTDEHDCGDDHVVAVNLTRELPQAPSPGIVREAVQNVCQKTGFRSASRVQLIHYLGGPCDEELLVSCVVLGGGGCGWTAVAGLEQALELAHTRAIKRGDEQGDICGGQTVQLTGLVSAQELNGEIGIALRFDTSNNRWLVRLRNGEGKQLKPSNLEGLDGATGRVMCFWGDARWSRTQLLGEIARGSWGLCKANVGDVGGPINGRWQGTTGRLAIAPDNQMSDNSMQNARRQMVAVRAAMQMHSPEEDPEMSE